MIMEKEIENLMMELNADSEYVSVSYTTNGYWKAVQLDEVILWDSENYNENYANQTVSAHLLKVAKHLEEKANEILVAEVGKHMLEVKTVIKMAAPEAKVSYFRENALTWKLSLSGEYPETDFFNELMEGFELDFEHIFQYAKLDVKW